MYTIGNVAFAVRRRATFLTRECVAVSVNWKTEPSLTILFLNNTMQNLFKGVIA